MSLLRIHVFIVSLFSSVEMFKADDVVWVNLGSSYGWWPAVIVDEKVNCDNVKDLEVRFDENFRRSVLKESRNTRLSPPVPKRSRRNQPTAKVNPADRYLVRFFDDDKFEFYTVTESARICNYSDGRKLHRIKDGLKKFRPRQRKSSIFDFRSRQAQFYKDVEMAEVLTDNSIQVAKLLEKYQVVDDQSNT